MAKPAQKSRRGRRLALLALLLIVAAWLGRGWWLEPWAAQRLASSLQSPLGGTVTVGKVTGSWWSNLIIENVVADDCQNGALRRLAVAHLRADYDPAIALGDLSHCRSIRADGVELVIDARNDPNDTTPAADTWPAFIALLPELLPEIRANGSMRILLDEGTLTFSGIGIIANGQRIAVSVSQAYLPWLDQPVTASMLFRRTDRGRLELIDTSDLGLATLMSAVIQADETEQSIHAAASVADGQVNVHVAPGTWSVSVNHVDLGTIPDEARRWLPPDFHDARGRVTAELSGTDGLTYAVEIQDLVVPWLHLRSAEVVGNWHYPVARFDKLLINSGDGIRLSSTGMTVDVSGGLHGNLEIQAQDIVPALRRAGVNPAWLPEGKLAVTARIHDEAEGFTADHLSIIAPGLAFRGSAGWTGPTDDQWHFDADLEVDAEKCGWQIPVPQPLTGKGNLHASYSGTLDDRWREGDMQLSGAITDFGIGSFRLPLLDLQADSSNRVIDLRVLTSIEGMTIASEATLAVGSDWSLEAVIPGLSIMGRGLTLHNRSTLRIAYSSTGWHWDEATFTCNGGTISTRGRYAGTGADTKADIDLQLEDVDVEALSSVIGVPLTGRIDARLHVNGHPLEPIADLILSTDHLTIAEAEAHAAIALRQDATGIHLDRAEIHATDYVTLDGDGTWPMRFGIDGIHHLQTTSGGASLRTSLASLDRLYPQLFTSGELACSARVTPDAQGLPIMDAHVVLREARLQIPDPLFTTGRQGNPPSFNLEANIHADRSQATGDLRGSVNGQNVLLGTVTTSIDGEWESWPITGNLTLDHLNLNRFATISSQIVRLQGELTGSFSLEGTLGNPLPHGRLSLDHGECKLRADVPTIAAAEGDIVLDGNTITITSLSSEMGYAPVWVESGTITFNGPEPVIDVHVKATNALLVQNRDLRIRANTSNLSLTGPLSALVASGRITITSGLYSRPIELISTGGSKATIQDGRLELFTLREPPLSNMRFDLTIQTDAQETVSTVPNKEDTTGGIRIQNNLVNARCEVDLHLGGTGVTPVAIGRVTAREAYVLLPFSVLQVERAELIFPSDDPFRPRAELIGRSQVRQWQVNVAAKGPIDDVAIEATAPGVSDEDAIMLLSTGATRQELADPDGQRAMLSRVGTYVGKELLRTVRGPSDPDASDTILDRWTLEFGREVSRNGEETIDAEIRLVPYSERIGWFLYGQKDRYEEYNLGITLRFRWGGYSP